MHNEFSAVFEQTEEWFIGFCHKPPGAHGQGKTHAECRDNLAQAVALLLEDRREDVLRGVPKSLVETLIVDRPMAA